MSDEKRIHEKRIIHALDVSYVAKAMRMVNSNERILLVCISNNVLIIYAILLLMSMAVSKCFEHAG